MPIFNKEHADLVIAHIGDKSDIQQIFGLMPQKIAVVHFDDSKACLDEFTNSDPRPAEFILLDATRSAEDTNRFLTGFRSNTAFKKVPVSVMAESDDEETCQRFLDLGANFCIAKLDVLADRGSLSQIITDYWMSG